MSRLQIDPSTWAVLSELLDRAIDLPPAERSSWVDALGAQYDGLKPQLRDLLTRAGAVETGDFLHSLPRFDLAGADDGGADPAPGQKVGGYRLVRALGQGGMGSVWLAERVDGLVNRPVALKLPHLVAARRADLAERMAREREILATLDHRNIARLLDAGIAGDGQPFLALEFVEGVPIDRYCAGDHSRPPLDVVARLTLFRQVADAVAYAHGKLILHRDLKPANILVTDDGGVRLLDFGIAKLLEEGRTRETRLTEVSGRALTPDYASPEQILGEPLTVASDVYSLGVILFELLAGSRPYRLKRDFRGAVEHAVLNAEPLAVSQAAPPALRGRLRGDLDTIVAKALKKNPAERYATVNALADDILNHLERRPVSARPDSNWYRLRRFVARNRVVVSASAVAVVALISAATISFWQARAANLARQRAESVRDLIAGIFSVDQPNLKDGRPVSAVELLRQTVAATSSSPSSDPIVRAEIQRTLAHALLRLADVETAATLAERALSSARASYPPDHLEVIRARLLASEVHRYRGRLADMRTELDAILAVLSPTSVERRELLFDTYLMYVHFHIDAVRYAEASAAARRAKAFAERHFDLASPQYARALGNLALTTLLEEKHPEALALATEALERTVAAASANPLSPTVLSMRVVHARALGQVGRVSEAADELAAVARSASLLYGADSRMVGFQRQNLVSLLLRSGRIREAVESARQALETLTRFAEPDSFTIVAARNALANALLAARESQKAVPLFEGVVVDAPRLFGATHRNVFEARASLALARAISGDQAGAEADAQRLARDVAAMPGFRSSRVSLNLGIIDRMGGRPASAIAAIESAVAAGGTFRDDWEKAVARIELALAHEGREDRKALELLRSALETLQGAGHKATPYSADAQMAIARIHLRGGRLGDALVHARAATDFWSAFAPDSSWAVAAASLRNRIEVADAAR